MVEGAPLLREYTLTRIEGSNPFVSAKTSNIMTYNQILGGFATFCVPHFVRHFVFEGPSIRLTRMGSSVCERLFLSQVFGPIGGRGIRCPRSL